MRRARLRILAAVLVGLAAADFAPGQDVPQPATPGATAKVDLARAWELRARVKDLHGEERYAEAVPLAEESVALLEKALGPEHLDVASGLDIAGVCLRPLREYGKARSRHDRALAIRQRLLGPEHPMVAASLTNLGNLLGEQGAYAEARPLHERALAIRQKALGPDHPEVARSLGNLALVLSGLQAYEEARLMLERTLAIEEKVFGPDHPALAVTLGNLAVILLDQGSYKKALEHNARALAIWEKAAGPRHPKVALCLDNLANILVAQGAYAEARPLEERALGIWEEALGPDDPQVATSLSNLAALLEAQGASEEARPLYERSLAIREAALGPEHLETASSLNNLAELLRGQGAFEQARALHERVLAIREKALGPEQLDVARSLTNLALVLREQGAPGRARLLLERALAIEEKALGPDHPQVARTLIDLGVLLAEGAEGAKARPLVERALAIQEKALGPGHPDVAGSLENLADLLADGGAYADARPLQERALAIREKALGPDHPAVADSLGNLAQVLAALGAADAARPLFRRALAIEERSSRRSFATAADRLSLVASMRPLLDRWLEFTATGGEPGYDAVLRVRGLAGRAGEVERRAVRRAGGAALAIFDDLRAAQARLARLANAPPGDDTERASWREEYARMAARCDELSLELARRSAGYSEARGRLDLAVADIQGSLAEGEAAVDFLRRGDRFTAWVLGRDGPPRRVELGSAGALEEAAQRFRTALLAASDPRDPSFLAAGKALRALAWDPAAAALPTGTATVFVVPDGALAAIPFGAMPGREAGRFLLDERAIVYLGAPQDLVPWGGRSQGEGALAIGAVDYDRSAEGLSPAMASSAALAAADPTGPAAGMRAPGGVSFTALAATGPEAEGVIARVRAAAPTATALVLRGPHATEANLRRLAPGRRFLHLATHGFIRHDLRSALDRPAGRTKDLAPSLERHVAGIDPMLLAGLALAGANPRTGGGLPPKAGEGPSTPSGARSHGGDHDDGILTALEAGALDLDGVDLVCLSACDTAGGTARAGEGVLGLVRGFRAAGAKDVVASLWPVEDEASRGLMGRLYGGVLESGRETPPALALRAAALALRDEEVEVHDPDASLVAGKSVAVRGRPFAAPRHWAAFVAYGPVR